VQEALQGEERRIEKIWVAYGRAGAGIGKILAGARAQNIPVSRRDRSTLDEKAGTSKHQGVLALCALVGRMPLDDFLEGLPEDPPRFLALLDGVQDPHNLGAVIRSACAAGVGGILLPERRSCPVTPVVAKASAGALEHVPLVEAGNASEALRQMRDQGIVVIGADSDGEREIYDMDLRGDICVVLGGEGKGLRPGLRKQCDHLVSLPMTGPVASLNVSVASALMFYEVVRQRRVT
jgi:23S rRNA (guanosine2251-2'-O)-methyltransferase